jgi:triphosphoribosyl-dephospho-CoA synthase
VLPRELQLILSKACRLDVVAFKPGNVSLWSSGHGMQAADFLTSAKVAVPPMCDPQLALGERIETAVAATMAAVGCNTNLGIVLLLAPLAVARAMPPNASLRARLATILSTTSVHDSECCYRAISCANPAGLGAVSVADVNSKPTLNLRDAMGLAADYDSIAQQYINDFELVFNIGVPLLRYYRTRWRSLAWATTACYVSILASIADSHVARKFGLAAAHDVCARSQTVATATKACENPRRLVAPLSALDRELKLNGINPGTTADLTVASVAALLLEERCEPI